MPNTPDTLIQPAKERTQKRAMSDPWLVAAYLTGWDTTNWPSSPCWPSAGP